MKALSGRQPWWWAILHQGKRIVNRRWNTNYRGPILLHAAKGCTKHEYRDAVDWMVSAKVVRDEVCVPPIQAMQRGGIVGRARIVDVITPVSGDMYAACGLAMKRGIDHRLLLLAGCHLTAGPFVPVHAWHMHEQFGFVLADVEPLTFVPYKGSLGLFDVDEAVLELEDQ